MPDPGREAVDPVDRDSSADSTTSRDARIRSIASCASSTGSPPRATRTTSSSVRPRPVRRIAHPQTCGPSRRSSRAWPAGRRPERVAEDRGRESALRRERQPLERAERARLLDPRRELGRPSRADALFVVTRPSTAVFSSGTAFSGSNEPERASSYSSMSRWALTRGNSRSASQSYPPSTSQREAWFPRQRCKPNVTPSRSPKTRLSSSRPSSSQRSAGQPRLA